jgi:hypothetical protein
MPADGLAASGTFDCAQLQAAFDQAGQGDVIVVEGVCTSANSGDAKGSFNLKTGVRITLRGAPGAGFDGTDAPGRILTGQSVGATRIADLFFRDGDAASGPGGAVLLDGDSTPILERNEFYGNAAEGPGGAVAVVTPQATSGTLVVINSLFGHRTEAGLGNRGGTGGALFVQTSRPVEVRSNLFAANLAGDTGGGASISSGSEVTFSSNLVEGNRAVSSGGGAQICCGRLNVVNNAFRVNRVFDPDGLAAAHRGGGLTASSAIGGGPGNIAQFANVFDGNAVTFAESTAGVNGGGAEWVNGSNLSSRNDLFLSNALQGAPAGGASHGGALRVGGCAGETLATTLENVAVVGNSLGAGGAGAGISALCTSGSNNLRLLNATVAGNPSADGTAAAIDGGGSDVLSVANSIVWPAGGAPAHAGFGSRSATFSLLCDPGAPGQPFAGAGNLCADPRLADPAPGVANYHQTSASPTVDAGSNELVSETLGVDIEGNARITDGNGDGQVIVDMGADESPAVPARPAPPDPPAPGGGSDAPGPPPPTVVVNPPAPNALGRVLYVRVIISRRQGRYLVTRIASSRRRARIRLRLIDGRGRSHSVTRTVRANRAISLRNLPLVGIRLIRVSVIG